VPRGVGRSSCRGRDQLRPFRGTQPSATLTLMRAAVDKNQLPNGAAATHSRYRFTSQSRALIVLILLLGVAIAFGALRGMRAPQLPAPYYATSTELIGTWKSADGATLELTADGYFTTTGVPQNNLTMASCMFAAPSLTGTWTMKPSDRPPGIDLGYRGIAPGFSKVGTSVCSLQLRTTGRLHSLELVAWFDPESYRFVKSG
jgi:hypothetical protein